jgi:hypothetical protein
MHCLCVASNCRRLFASVLLLAFFLTAAAKRPPQSHTDRHSPLSTCPYRSINHVTHSLLQQCLPKSHLSTPTAARAESSSQILVETQLPSIPGVSPASTLASSTSTVEVRPHESTRPKNPTDPSPSVPEDDADSQSPLGKGHFLSFEEWKKQNLDKYGQSPDQFGRPKKHDPHQPRRQPIIPLDALGDDAEIDFDFGGFSHTKPQIAVPGNEDIQSSETGDLAHGRGVPSGMSRSKAAGTTFKERFNYASFDCAATVLKTNAKISGSSSVLVENKDSYMLNECSVANKFLVLELCEDILIDTIVLANFEFFSSIFRTFRVSVSDRYPVKSEKWKDLGTFEARNTREVQAFLVENPLIWAKYVRLEFLTHYGNEFYCPISLVRVHGTTMLEDYRHDEEPNKAEDRDYDQNDYGRSTEAFRVTGAAVSGSSTESPADVEDIDIGIRNSDIRSMPANESALRSSEELVTGTSPSSHGYRQPITSPSSPNLARSTSTFERYFHDPILQQCRLRDIEADEANGYSSISGGVEEPVPPGISSTTAHTRTTSRPLATLETLSRNDREHPSDPVDADVSQPPAVKQYLQPGDSDSPTKTANNMGAENDRPPVSSTQSPPSNPTVQESFFKSVQKRLQVLESNSTLSLQYVEDQSMMLRDAFSKVEQRQLLKSTSFIEYLNGTVLNELREFRQQYDQLWQSTVLELEAQREQSQREFIAMNSRLGLLTEELVFQKRMAVLQSVLVVFCIGLVLFSRSAVHSYLEHPLVQSMLSRSATFRVRGPFLETPSLSPETTRPNSSYAIPSKAGFDAWKGHRAAPSDGSQRGVEQQTASYSMPTSASFDGRSEAEGSGDVPLEGEISSPSPSDPQRSTSSPPIIHRPIGDTATPFHGLRAQ